MAEAPYTQAPTNHASVNVTGESTGTNNPNTQHATRIVNSNTAMSNAARAPLTTSCNHCLQEDAFVGSPSAAAAEALTSANKGPMNTRTTYLVTLTLMTNSMAQMTHSKVFWAKAFPPQDAINQFDNPSEAAPMPHQPARATHAVKAIDGTHQRRNGPIKSSQPRACQAKTLVDVLMVRMWVNARMWPHEACEKI